MRTPPLFNTLGLLPKNQRRNALCLFFCFGLIFHQTLGYAEISCTETPEAQSRKIKDYDAQIQETLSKARRGDLEKKPILNVAENSFQEYQKTGCKDYLLQSVFLYKNHYDWMEKPGTPQNAVNESTQNQYKRWHRRLQAAEEAQGTQELSTSFQSKMTMDDLKLYQTKLTAEQKRVGRLLFQRNAILIPSVAAVAAGITLTALSSVILARDGQITSDIGCGPYNDFPCQRHAVQPATNLGLGFGIALFVGGSAGIGVALYRANHQPSPLDR